MYFNELSGPIFGWINSKVYDETLAATKDESKAEQAAVGWCSQVLDTNGDGKITKPFQTAPRGGFDNLLYVTDTLWRQPTRAAPAPPAARGAPAAPAAGAAPATALRRQPAQAAVAAAAHSLRRPSLSILRQDSLVGYSLYSVIPSPVDDSVWAWPRPTRATWCG